MFIQQFKRTVNDLLTSLNVGEAEIEKLKTQATLPYDDKELQSRLDTIELLKLARADYAQAVCTYLMLANEVLVKLAETEFLLTITCPPDKFSLVEVPEIETLFPGETAAVPLS